MFNFPDRFNILRFCALTTVFICLFQVAATNINSQTISDLESQSNEFRSDAQELYKLDNDNMMQIWEAYCGLLDPKIKEDREFATDIAKQLQYKEEPIIEQLLEGEFPRLMEMAKKLEPENKDKVSTIVEILKKEESNLRKLYDGVVLKGSNHPFIQFAIEYGKKMHDDMCDDFGESPRVCDKNFPGMDGRPDLVTFESGHLVIYEFKPDNSRAKSLGWDQVKDYLEPVQEYYQSFFVNGREGEFKGEPDSDHGGKTMIEKLKASKDAWESDGKTLRVIPEVRTYRVCDQPRY